MKFSTISNVPTKDLCDFLVKHLTSLGFPGVTADERWEGDGVFIIGPPPADPDIHWYLECCGNDVDAGDFTHGGSIVFIRPVGAPCDDVYELEELEDIERHLRENKYLPVT